MSLTKRYKDQWLSHLKDSVTSHASITGISLYTIALEGWRRGLTLKFYSDTNIGERKRVKYILESNYKAFYFDDSSGNLNSDQAVTICDDKELTNKYLQKANVPIPKGKEFKENQSIEEIISYASTLRYPLVVKPVDGLGGTGVIVNIQNEKELQFAIQHVREKLSFKRILIQEHITGKEVRIYVLDGKILGAANRVPAHVMGDGKKTIIELIHEKNKARKTNPNLKHRLIRIDSSLIRLIEHSGYTLDDILKKNELLYLREISNVSIGGEPVDYTDQLTQEQKRIAVDAVKAIPGLTQCGVDMMIDENNNGIILEMNASPGIGSHLFPVKGQARDIPKKIIDFYFPNTKNLYKERSMTYYNLEKLLDSLLNGTVKKVELPRYPEKGSYSKKYIIKLNKSISNFNDDLKYFIEEKGYNGFIKKMNDQLIHIVINTNDQSKLFQFDTFLLELEEKGTLQKIESNNYKKAVNLGFEFLEKEHKSLAELELKHRQLYREVRHEEREVRRLERRLSLMKNSRFWRLTKPLRIFQKYY